MELNTDLNEVVKKTHEFIFKLSNDTTPVIDYNVKVVKEIEGKWYEVEMKIKPLNPNNNTISLIREFLYELEDIERGHKKIEDIIKNYKKWLLIE